MSAKPGTLCKLEKGKIIDAQEGFVDTFNWMVDFINNLAGDGIIKIDSTSSDKPVIKLSGCPFIAGDDTNIKFEEVRYGTDKGKYKVDVYYK